MCAGLVSARIHTVHPDITAARQTKTFDLFETVPDKLQPELQRMSCVHIQFISHSFATEKTTCFKNKQTNKKQSQENTFNRHLLVTGAGFTGWACRLWEFPSTSVQGCDQEPSPLQSVNMNRIEEREHHMKVALSHTELHR